ncbi:MAG: hypothetical protein ACYDCO_01710 [Armatimonadota bacterium]
MTDEQTPKTPKTQRDTLWQAVGRLEGEVNMHKEQITELFSIDRKQAETNAKHAATNAETAIIVKSLAETVKAQHTPDTCTMRPQVQRMWNAFLVLAGLVGIATALGLLKELGKWLITHFHLQ